MRTLTLLALSLLLPLVASAQPAERQGPGTPPADRPAVEATPGVIGALLFEDFESAVAPALPDGWVAANLNSDEREWGTGVTGGDIPPDRASSGVQYAGVFWNPAAPADDWLFSPGVDVTAGTEYRIRFYFKPGDPGFSTAENFALYYGSGPDAAQMEVELYLIQGDPAASPGRFIDETFTPTTSGTIHFGFYCFSDPDQYFCGIDDVEVTVAGQSAAEDGPDGASSLLRTVSPNPASGVATVTLSSTTSERVVVGVYDALGRRVLEAFDGAVAGGTDVTVTMDVSSLPAGAYVVRATGETATGTMPLTIVR